MFKAVYKRFQEATLFEKLLLLVGILVGMLGFWLINTTFLNEPNITWPFITSVFLWLLLIFVVILTDSNESIKEELAMIIKEHIKETKLIKKEIELLRDVMSKKKK